MREKNARGERQRRANEEGEKRKGNQPVKGGKNPRKQKVSKSLSKTSLNTGKRASTGGTGGVGKE